jgi:WD40 repeat protein
VRVIALGYTADGTMLVTVGRNGFVRLWGPNGGPVEADLAVPEPSPDGIVTATIAPDGRTLAVATSEGLPRLFDLPSLRARPPLADDPNRGRIRSVSFAADGRIAAGDDLGFRVWDADGQLHLTSANVPSGPFLAFAPDGRTLALGGEAVRLYDAATGRERLVLRWENGYLTGLAFSPDGAALAASSSTGIVTLWDAVTGHEKGKMRHPAAVNSVAFLPDGRRLVAGTETAVLQTWTVADRRSLGVRVVFSPARGPGAFWYGGARAIAFRTDGREFAVACGGAVAIFPLTALPAE